MQQIPVPDLKSSPRILACSFALDALARRKAAMGPTSIAGAAWTTAAELGAALAAVTRASSEALGQMVALQEELDWAVYNAFGLCPDTQIPPAGLRPCAPVDRPFEWLAAADGSALPEPMRATYQLRRDLIARESSIRFMETRVFKRSWEGQRGVFGHNALSTEDRTNRVLESFVLDHIEQIYPQRVPLPLTLRDVLTAPELTERPRVALEHLAAAGQNTGSSEAALRALIEHEAVPFASVLRFSESGLAKRDAWEEAWRLQRRADAGETVVVPVPPKFDNKDYLAAEYWYPSNGTRPA